MDSLLYLLDENPARDARRVDLMNKVVRTYYWIDPGTGERIGREAVALAREVGDPSLLGIAISNMVGARQCYQIDDQQPLLSEAIGLLERSGPPVELGYALYRKAVYPSNSNGDPDSVQYLLRRAMGLFKEGNDRLGQAWILGWQAQVLPSDSVPFGDSLFRVVLEYASHYGPSEEANFLAMHAARQFWYSNDPAWHEHYQKAIDAAHMAGSTAAEAQARAQYAGALRTRSLFDLAQDEVLRSLKLFERIQDTVNIATETNELGCLYRALGEHQQALPYLRSSLAICLKRGPPDLVINNMNELSAIDLVEGEADSALFRSEEALQRTFAMGRSQGDRYFNFHLWESHFGIGSAYEALGDLPQAIKHFTIADSAASAIPFDQESLKARNKLSLALFASDPSDPTSSMRILEENVRKASDLGLLVEQRDAVLGLSQVNERAGNERAALEYLKAYILIKDSILDLEKMRAITGLNIRFGTEKKDLEITALTQLKAVQAKEIEQEKRVKWLSVGAMLLALISAAALIILLRNSKRGSALLSAKNAAIVEAQGRLVVSERQREAAEVRTRIARDVHDQLGSDLTKLVMLSGEMRALANEDPAGITRSAEDIERVAGEANRSLGDIVWAVDPHHDSLAGLTERVRAHCERMLKWSRIQHTINCAHEGPDNALDPATKRDIYLVLREALNNAIKYSKAKHIHVKFRTNAKTVTMTVEDDGIGFDPEGVKDGGHGLDSMRARAERIHGRLAIESALGNGVRVSLETSIGA